VAVARAWPRLISHNSGGSGVRTILTNAEDIMDAAGGQYDIVSEYTADDSARALDPHVA
jgi:hypothetical protein